MRSKIKAGLYMLPLIAALLLSSCRPSAAPPEAVKASTATPALSILKTTLGDFVITSSRLVDEVHDQKPRPGEKFLLVALTQPGVDHLDPGTFKLEDFQKMIQDSNGQIYVSGKDSSPHISNMAGWVEDQFVMGFTVPNAETYTLHWPGNPEIELAYPKKD